MKLSIRIYREKKEVKATYMWSMIKINNIILVKSYENVWILNLSISSHSERNLVYIYLQIAIWAEKLKSLATIKVSKI